MGNRQRMWVMGLLLALGIAGCQGDSLANDLHTPPEPPAAPPATTVAASQRTTSQPAATRTLGPSDEIIQELAKDLAPQEKERFIRSVQDLKKSIQSGWHPPWANLTPALTDQQLHDLPTVDLARKLFASGLPARTQLLQSNYSNPIAPYARLVACYPGYAELFARPDVTTALLKLLADSGAELDGRRDDQTNLNTIMVLRSLSEVCTCPILRKRFAGSAPKVIEAHVQALAGLKRFVHAADPPAKPPPTAPHFAVVAANALVESSLQFAGELSADKVQIAREQWEKQHVNPENHAAVEQHLTQAIEILRPFTENK